MTIAVLTASYNSGLTGDPNLTLKASPTTTYCFSEVGQTSTLTTWYYAGPGGTITSTKPAGC